MIVVIFGSRPPKKVLYGSRGALMRWYEENRHFVDEAVQQSGFKNITEVVCGEAPGFDTLGKFWANTHGIPIKSMPAKWQRIDGTTDKSAGFARNREMGEYAAAGIGLWDGSSPGTKQMANILLLKKKPCYVLRVT